MKSYTNLFEKICAFENLYLASRRAEKGKRFRHEVAVFNARRAENLLQLQRELQSGTYQPGGYHTFGILRPKPRQISAAPYRDRVVHHAICNVIAPLFEKKFIRDSYANQRNKGTHAALDRCTYYARRYRYVLHLDIRKYFPSIDHEILLAEISRTIRCQPTLDLIHRIIANSNAQEPANFYFPGDDLFTPFERRKGLPIGNLTSQFFANVYLNPLDHFIKEVLRLPGYLRYVDDLLAFDDDKAVLHDCKYRIADFVESWRLQLHPKKARVYAVSNGIAFLGFRVFPDHRRLLEANLKTARQRLRALRKAYRTGKISREKINSSVQSWIGHASHGDTWKLRETLFQEYAFSKSL